MKCSFRQALSERNLLFFICYLSSWIAHKSLRICEQSRLPLHLNPACGPTQPGVGHHGQDGQRAYGKLEPIGVDL
jgi:hypothetical protein